MRFADRRLAGEKLGRAVAELKPANPLVEALPRGGVPVGFEVAQALGCELDVLVVRKIGVPHQPELAMGAVAEGGVTVKNDEIMQVARVPSRQFDHEADLARRELSRRLGAYREAVAAVDPAGRTVIVIDDGLATGSTAEAAISAVRARDAAAAWLAVPVAPRDSVARLEGFADRVIVLETPRRFLAVGAWYLDFAQTSDSEVLDLLKRSRA